MINAAPTQAIRNHIPVRLIACVRRGSQKLASIGLAAGFALPSLAHASDLEVTASTKPPGTLLTFFVAFALLALWGALQRQRRRTHAWAGHAAVAPMLQQHMQHPEPLEQLEQLEQLGASLGQKDLARNLAQSQSNTSRQLSTKPGTRDENLEPPNDHDRLKLALHAGDLGLWDWQVQSGEIYINDIWAAMLGYTKAELLERFPNLVDCFRELLHPEDRERTIALNQAYIEQAQPSFQTQFRLLHKSGEYRWIQSTGKATQRDSDGRALRVVGIHQDITQPHGMVEQLQSAKNDLLANINQEIRGPMSTVMGMTHMLRQTTLTPQQSYYVDKIQHSGRRLLGFVNDMLEITKIESGELTLQTANFSLLEILGEVVNLASTRARAKGLELSLNLDDSLPLRFAGDPLRLQQILVNLIGNAIKFTDEGEVDLHVTAVGQEDDRIKLRFAVRDTGVGLSEQQMARLFRDLDRASAHTVSLRRGGGSGTGLGLAISHRLAVLMGGHISVTSSQGHGSTFSFTAWLHKAKDSQPSARPLPSSDHWHPLVDDPQLSPQAMALAHQTKPETAAPATTPDTATSTPAQTTAQNSEAAAATAGDTSQSASQTFEALAKQAQLDDIEGLDAAVGLSHVGGNVKLYVSLLRGFHESSAHFHSQVQDALTRGDYALAERLAHTLRSSTTNLGALPLKHCAQQLESAIRHLANSHDAKTKPPKATTTTPLQTSETFTLAQQHLNDLLKQTDAALLALLQAVTRKLMQREYAHKHAPASANNETCADPQELLRLSQELLALLGEFDAEAESFVLEHAETFESGYPEHFDALMRAVSELDLEGAESVLQEAMLSLTPPQ